MKGQKIFVLKDGKVINTGNHDFLIDNCQEYCNTILEEERNKFKNDLAMFIYTSYNKNIEGIKIININYDYIMKKVKSQQEKEKKEITDELRDLKPDAKEVERFKKKYKNDGRWTKGNQLDLIKYNIDTYDKETTNVTNMDSYLMGEINENNNISMLDEDYSDGVDVTGMIED